MYGVEKSLGSEIVGRVFLVIVAASLVWAATAFLALAIFTLLVAAVGTAPAAVLTAGILLVALLIGVLVYFALARPAQPVALAQQTAQTANNSVVAVLAELAKDHPLLAIGCATLLGVSDTLRSDHDRRN